MVQPGRHPLPRRIRIAALLLAIAAVATVVAIRIWPRTPHRPAAVPPRATSLPAAVFPTTTEGTKATPPWPTAPGACGSNVDLPIVSSTPPNEHTGVTVLLGGAGLRTVDFDSGRTTAIAQARLRPGEYVVELSAAAQTYAVVTTCQFATVRVLRIGAGGNISKVPIPGSIDTVLADGAHAWGLSLPKNDSSSGYIVPLDGGIRVRLPAGLSPDLVTDGVIVGNVGSPTGTGALLLVDAATGHVRGNLGNGLPVAAGRGVVLWTVGCEAGNNKPCTLHRRSVAGGTTSSYRLPRPPGFTASVLSADGRLLAFTLERAREDPRYQLGHPIPPSDIAILHLDTGLLEIVPGIETPAKLAPGLAFSADNRWLEITLDAGPNTRLLAWRSGLTHPYESKPIGGAALSPPPLVVVP